jgi:DNA polymerase III epsilon subunit-like protein
MYLDRKTASEQAQSIVDLSDWLSKWWRRLTFSTPAHKTVFLDTETTGLKPGPLAAEVVEIAMITEHPDGSIDRWVTKVAPQHIETASQKALEINGFDPKLWADAPAPSEISDHVADVLNDAVVVGHNVAFDLRFVQAMFIDNEVSLEVGHRDSIDTVSLAKEHLKPLGLAGLPRTPTQPSPMRKIVASCSTNSGSLARTRNGSGPTWGFAE